LIGLSSIKPSSAWVFGHCDLKNCYLSFVIYYTPVLGYGDVYFEP